jgi:3-oxoacyl-[acyl-carrier protein] reductase
MNMQRNRRSEPSPELRLAPAPGARVAVLGGCGGFGRAVVDACLAADLRVVVADLPASLERHPPGPGVASALALDATDSDAVAAAFASLDAELGGLDALIFLVGYTLVPPRPLESIEAAEWDDVLAGNLRSAYLVARHAAPVLRRGADPALVMVSSAMGVAPQPGHAPYAAAKAGLIALTKSLALELAPAVRANAIAPSASHTAFMAGGTGRGRDGDDAWFAASRYPVDAIPLGRMCEPADVVGPALFLAGPASGFMTGQVLHVNGGRFMP